MEGTTIGNRGAGVQDRPVRGGKGSQPDLGRGLSGLQLRIPAWARTAGCIGRAVGGIVPKKVNWILDLDIRSFFDKLQHGWLVQFVEHRIGDKRIVRLIQKWLKAGVLEQGQWSETKEGSPQGSVISPVLANLYLHYVLDL